MPWPDTDRDRAQAAGAPRPAQRRPRPRLRTRRDSGFTLLEVLVALTVLSLAVVAAIQGFAQGLRLLKVSGDHQQAMMLADLKTREVVTPQEGREEGAEGAFHWERTERVIEAPDLTPVGSAPRWRVYEIVVRVRWEKQRQVELTTLRTVPIEQTLAPSTTTGAEAGASARVPARGASAIRSPGTSGALPGRSSPSRITP